MRWTVARLTPAALAIERQLHCVAPGGFSCSVACTMACTWCAAIPGFRPAAKAHLAHRVQSVGTKPRAPIQHRRSADAEDGRGWSRMVEDGRDVTIRDAVTSHEQDLGAGNDAIGRAFTARPLRQDVAPQRSTYFRDIPLAVVPPHQPSSLHRASRPPVVPARRWCRLCRQRVPDIDQHRQHAADGPGDEDARHAPGDGASQEPRDQKRPKELPASPPATSAATTGIPIATSALIALTHSARN